ncbi:PREDICTED: zinc finger protein 260-like [Habropoda laboriosa]|uniref:zinc finger protein 260-like n=1 Tax=Habropoda laboriosa TaxID=597456 RepID=UPI00083D84EB|nr:PREDICTED: zinc finger protein 260-like [Habropoda laboriosa]
MNFDNYTKPSTCNPLEHTYLIVRNVGKYFLLPVDRKVDKQKPPTEQSITPEIKTELLDEVVEEIPDEPCNEEIFELNEKLSSSSVWSAQTPLELSEYLKQHPTSSSMITKYTNGGKIGQIFCCDCCGKIFRRKETLRKHINTHDNKRTFECSVCHQLLKTKRTLLLHMGLHEHSGKLYECTDCDFISKRSHSLKRHQIRRHTKYFDYKCHQCPKMFKLQMDFKRHLLKHVVEPCRCDVCGKVYQNEYFLRVHQTMGKNRRTACCRRYERVKGGQEVSENGVSKGGKGRKVFKCPQCKWRFRNWRLLHRHMQRHLLSYKCNVCGAVFKYKASFLKHEEAHRDKDAKSTRRLTTKNKSSSILQRRIIFRASRNRKRRSNSRRLNNSCRVQRKNLPSNCRNFEPEETNEDEKVSSMNSSSKRSSPNLDNCWTNKSNNRKDSTQQEDLYKKLNDGTYTCDICQTTFEQKSKILRHITSKHSFHRPFKCSTCDKTFKYKCDLKAHRLVHQDVDSSLLHCCDKCDYRTKTKNNLKSHYIRRHTDDYKFACEHCGKRFKMEWDLKFHIGTHSNSQHMCDICGKFYTSNYSLYKHRKVAHLNEYKFQCNVCNKRLLTQENLDNHMEQHSRTYECKECGKVFASKRYLATHTTTHTGVKPYTCHICKKNFRTSHMRNTHLLTHSAERPHICDLCGQSFKRRYYMIEHRRKHPDAHLSSPPVPIGRKKTVVESGTEATSEFQTEVSL